MPARRTALTLLRALTALVAALALFRAFDTLPEGLRATYSSGPMAPEVGIPATRVEPQPSTASILSAWGGRPPANFSTTWTGSLLAARAGAYTFATRSDDGSSVYIDGRRVVDNGGAHSARVARGPVDLEAGVHSIQIDYLQDGGGLEFELLWARGGGALQQVPSWALSARRTGYGRFLLSAAARRAFWPVLFAWAVALLAFAVWRPHPWLGRLSHPRGVDPIPRALTAVIALSAVLNAIGLWWGVPSTWAGDEMTPISVYTAMTSGFSNGWWDRYPPLHYMVLSFASAPAIWLRSSGLLQISDAAHDALFIVLTRLVSVLAAGGTLIAVYLCGARAFGRRAGLYAAASLALVAPFLYYAKTANPEVPYIFWFMTSMVFYLRFLETLSTRDMVLFAAAATAAMCTKDQAYGLYLLTPIVFVHRLWLHNRQRGAPAALARALVDRRIIIAGATVASLFALIYLLPFNLRGFVEHFRDITGPGSEPWRMFEPTFAGRTALLLVNLRLNQRSWGWPLWIACLAGVAIALRSRETRRPAVWLLVPIVSYYLGFIDLVLYTFDRYVLPICVIQALFAGLAVDRFLHHARPPAPRWRRGAAALVFAYTLLYAATVDVLMVRDSRYRAERWLRERLQPGEGIGINFPERVLPRLQGIAWTEIGSAEHLRAARPRFFVLNADYARAVGPDTLLGEMIAELRGGRAGYHRAFSYRSPAPWPWLGGHPDLVGPRLETPVLSILFHINPEIEIYERN